MSNFALTNANIYTMNPKIPKANSLLVKDGHVHEVGVQDPLPSGVEVIDLAGRTVIPGLCDSHIHLEKYALLLTKVDCEVPTLRECLKRVEDRCKKDQAESWILGHGWNQNDWGRYGTLDELDSISHEHPVYLTAKSLHAAWANSKALQMCGISPGTPDPPKGKIQRDDQGKPTGILFEDAMKLISDCLPKLGPDALAERISDAQTRLNRLGITAVHDFDGLRCLKALEILEREDGLRLRVLKQIRKENFEKALEKGIRPHAAGDWIRIGHLKLFADGALGPRTAAMIKAYTQEPENFGMLQLELDELIELGIKAIDAGFPLAIHAIGDRANRVVLDTFTQLQTIESASLPLPYPHRIEHAQCLHPNDIKRPAHLGIVVSMQPIHAVSDQDMAERYWGDRIAWSYAWLSQIENGSRVIFGSDAPVESPNPWLGIHAAVTRLPNGQPLKSAPDRADQCLPVIGAIKGYTLNPAHAASWQNSLGQLSEGAFADLILLEEDPMGMNIEELPSIKPSGVMVGGNWVHRSF